MIRPEEAAAEKRSRRGLVLAWVALALALGDAAFIAAQWLWGTL